MSDVERWLAARMDGVPDALRARLLEAVREAGSVGGDGRARSPLPVARCSLPEALRRVGDQLLAQIAAAPASRDHALTLLAADALMTYAMEAEAEGEGMAGEPPASRRSLPDD